MENLGQLVEKMESQIENADSKLDLLSSRLDQFESRVLMPEAREGISSGCVTSKVIIGDSTEGNRLNGEDTTSVKAKIDDEDDDGIDPKLLTELLTEVRHVKQEYDHLVQNVHQVQELQQEVTRSLRKEMKQVQSHFDRLRERVIGSGGGSLPVDK